MGGSRPCLVAPRSDDDDNVDENEEKQSSSISSSRMSIDEIREQLECLRSLEVQYQSREYPQGKFTNDPVSPRVLLVEFLFKVVDYSKFQRDTVAYALTNIMDRYMSLPQQQQQADNNNNCYNHYQMVALTSLYIAVKLLERKVMELDVLVALADGDYTEDDFRNMEQSILQALDWKVGTGPTALSFCHLYLCFLPKSALQAGMGRAMRNHVQYQLELTLPEFDFMTHHAKPSEVALAAVYNALEGMDITKFPLKDQYLFRHTIVNVLCHVDIMQDSMTFTFENRVAKIQDRMRQILVEIVTYIRGNNSSSCARSNNNGTTTGSTTKDKDSCNRSVTSCETSSSKGSPVAVFQRRKEFGG